MEITHFYSLLRVSVIGHHVGSGSVCSFAFIQWVRASEISIPQCCSNVEADLALKIPAHTHKMQKTPWKPTIFFLDRTTVLLLVFFNAYFNMHMLFLMWSKYIQSRHVLPRLSAWEFVSVWDKRRAKNFRESWYRNEDGLVSVLVVRLWVWTQAGEIFICLLEAVVSSASLIKPGLIVSLAVKEGSLFVLKKKRNSKTKWGREDVLDYW